MKKERIIIIAALLAIVGLVFLLRESNHADTAQEQLAKEREQQVFNLLTQRDELQRQLDELNDSAERERVGNGQMVILFTQPRALLYTEIYPLTKAAGVPCVVAVSESWFPGSAGCITTAQMQELEAAGWGVCMAWDGVSDIHEWSERMRKRVEDADFSGGTSVYCPDGSYTTDVGKAFANEGFQIIVHHGESLSLSCTELKDSVWYPGAYAWNGIGSGSMPKNTAQVGGSLIMTISFEEGVEQYESDRFESLLSVSTTLTEKYGLQVTTLWRGRTYYLERPVVQDKEKKQQAVEIEEKIRLLQSEIDSIYAQESLS